MRKLSEQTAEEKRQFAKRMIGLARWAKAQGKDGAYRYATRTIATIRRHGTGR